MRPQRNAAAAVLFFRYIFLGRRYPQMLGGSGEGGQGYPRCGSECRNLQLGCTRYSARRYRPRLRTHSGNCSSTARNREAKWARSPARSRGGGPQQEWAGYPKAFPRRTGDERRDELHFTRPRRFWNRTCTKQYVSISFARIIRLAISIL
jgi:hypothetical protein